MFSHVFGNKKLTITIDIFINPGSFQVVRMVIISIFPNSMYRNILVEVWLKHYIDGDGALPAPTTPVHLVVYRNKTTQVTFVVFTPFRDIWDALQIDPRHCHFSGPPQLSGKNRPERVQMLRSSTPEYDAISPTVLENFKRLRELDDILKCILYEYLAEWLDLFMVNVGNIHGSYGF